MRVRGWSGAAGHRELEPEGVENGKQLVEPDRALAVLERVHEAGRARGELREFDLAESERFAAIADGASQAFVECMIVHRAALSGRS